MPTLKALKKKMATFLLTTEPNCSGKAMLMKKTFVSVCLILLVLSNTLSQQDSTQTFQVVLPLQVMNIDAKVVNRNVQLIWSVSSNEDAKGFEVERAVDGMEFKKIGGKLSLGRPGTESYEFVDALPRSNTAFSYRVKIVPKDGSAVYSDLRFIKINDEIIRCRLKQNPVRNSIDVEVISAEAVSVQLSVYTAYGQKLSTATENLTVGTNNFSLSSQNLLAGIHRLVLETGSERKVISFVKE
jgi:hypothetical protein